MSKGTVQFTLFEGEKRLEGETPISLSALHINVSGLRGKILRGNLLCETGGRSFLFQPCVKRGDGPFCFSAS